MFNAKTDFYIALFCSCAVGLASLFYNYGESTLGITTFVVVVFSVVTFVCVWLVVKMLRIFFSFLHRSLIASVIFWAALVLIVPPIGILGVVVMVYCKLLDAVSTPVGNRGVYNKKRDDNGWSAFEMSGMHQFSAFNESNDSFHRDH